MLNTLQSDIVTRIVEGEITEVQGTTELCYALCAAGVEIKEAVEQVEYVLEVLSK